MPHRDCWAEKAAQDWNREGIAKMHDMVDEMQSGESKPEGCNETVSYGCVEKEVFNLCSQSQTKAERAIEAYCKLRSIADAAKELEMSESAVSAYLVRERDRRGISDIRFLYANSEEDFNTGDNDKDAVRQSDLMKLVESQQYRCALSGIELTPETAALDHITPVAIGGEHAIANLQWLNCEVNRMKGMLSVEVFIDICRRVTATAEARQAHTPPPRV